MRKLSSILGLGLACALSSSAQSAPDLNIPSTVQLPQLKPIVPDCADPAADRFLEIDISKRPPAGATRVSRLSAWVTPDGVFHWPFVMRVRNIGDQPFVGKPWMQSAIVIEDEFAGRTKGKVAGETKFDRIAAHSGVAVRFEFTAPVEAIRKAKFHRIYTLSIKYDELSAAIVTGRNGDCDLLNNSFAVEFDGSRKGWIFGK
jgi:hypothetical protein